MTSKSDKWQGPNRADDAITALSAEHREVRELIVALSEATTAAIRHQTALLARIAQEVRASAGTEDEIDAAPSDDGAD